MSEVPTFRRSDYNNLEYVREIVLNRLRNDETWHVFDYNWGESRAERFVLFEDHGMKNRFIVLANEIMWQLLIQGVITAGYNAPNPSLPHFRVTDYGDKVLEEKRFLPHDATGYLKSIEGIESVLINETTIVYIEEALKCFNAGCHISAVLLLGIAAESCFLILCDEIKALLKKESEEKKLDEKIAVKTKHRWLVKKFESLPKADRRNQLPESLDTTFTSLYDLIRKQRNELGHPQKTAPKINREQAYIYFRLLPTFVEDLDEFINYCKINKF